MSANSEGGTPSNDPLVIHIHLYFAKLLDPFEGGD